MGFGFRFLMKIRILFNNVRGVNDKEKQKVIKSVIRMQEVDLVSACKRPGSRKCRGIWLEVLVWVVFWIGEQWKQGDHLVALWFFGITGC